MRAAQLASLAVSAKALVHARQGWLASGAQRPDAMAAKLIGLRRRRPPFGASSNVKAVRHRLVGWAPMDRSCNCWTLNNAQESANLHRLIPACRSYSRSEITQPIVPKAFAKTHADLVLLIHVAASEIRTQATASALKDRIDLDGKSLYCE